MTWRELLRGKPPAFRIQIGSFVVNCDNRSGFVYKVSENIVTVRWLVSGDEGWARRDELLPDLDSEWGFMQGLAQVSKSTTLDEQVRERLRELYELWLRARIIDRDRLFVAQLAVELSERETP